MSPVRTAGLALVQLRYEQKVFWRNIGAAFFTFAFPVLLYVLFGAVLGHSREGVLGGIRGIAYYTPAIAAYGLMSACFVSVALTVTFRRETGLLKKTRGTALPALSYFGGLAASAVVNAAVIVALIIAVGTLGYDAPLPRSWGFLLVTLAVGAASFCALALAVTALIPNFDAAPAVVNLVFLALLVISGGFFPLPSSSLLSQIADVFPLRHLILAAFAAFAGSGSGGSGLASSSGSGSGYGPGGFPWWRLGVVAAWGVAGLLAALRWFRWELCGSRR